MTDQEIIEGNKLIAEFMGGTTTTLDTCANYGQMQIPEWAFILYDFDTLTLGGYGYHTSWDWLMPVVEKIEACFEGLPVFIIKDSRAHIDMDTQLSLVVDNIDIPECYSGFKANKLEATYDTVIQFIQWYNNQSKQS